MKPSELKDKSQAELDKLVAEWKEELFGLKLKKSTNQLDKTHRLGEIKKDIARVATMKNAKKG
ncbi:50S ribosomal protein L29 [bacterium]|nr:50S ribosomal protein L29 [bacterium]